MVGERQFVNMVRSGDGNCCTGGFSCGDASNMGFSKSGEDKDEVGPWGMCFGVVPS